MAISQNRASQNQWQLESLVGRQGFTVKATSVASYLHTSRLAGTQRFSQFCRKCAIQIPRPKATVVDIDRMGFLLQWFLDCDGSA